LVEASAADADILVDDVDVVIVGAGFAGLGIASALDRAGIRSLRILESAGELGGAWRDNTYPGCACDIPSPLYSYSFHQKPDWTRLFARQPEILEYLRDVVDQRDLTDRIRFHKKVVGARWLEREARWEVETADGSLYRAKFLVNAVGLLHHPVQPDVPGLGDFDGPVFHSANWRHDLDLRGKRVAVIGTGASAIQFVPAIADSVAELTVFQRTPPWIVGKYDRAFDDRHRTLARWFLPYRWWVRWRLYWIHERRASGFVNDESAMEATATLARKLIERQVHDDELRQKVTPNYTIGCKRVLISSDWYPTLGKPNVAVRAGSVERVEASAVRGEDGSCSPADVIIFGTGFDAQNNIRFPVTGRDGVTLQQAWSEGNQAYLGTVVAGFPNMFLMVGPNTGLGHNSQVLMIESQARYIVDALRRFRRRGARSLEVKSHVQQSFNSWLDGRMVDTVWKNGGCRSWYEDPGSGRNTILWPDTTIAFWRRTRRARLSDYHLR
jgi:cation diffusion facilitator CzcD-associated flavoprotein CzcO